MTPREKQNWFQRHDVAIVTTILLAVLLFAFLWPYFVVTVPAGCGGVVWSRIVGTRTDVIAPEGLHVIPPWNTIVIYNLRYQTVDSTFTVLADNGLEILVRVTTRYRPSEKRLGILHRELGPNYVNTIVIPEVGTAVRIVVSHYSGESLYTAGLARLQQEIVQMARERVRTRYVFIDDVIIREVVLPNLVSEAIQHKIEQEQASLAMRHRLDRETQEAERKRIEATGIRDFQALVSGGLSNQYLRYAGIQATFGLAQSPNTKILIVGAGTGGLPLIFNADSLAQGGAPTLPAPTPPAPFATPPVTPPVRPPGATPP